MTGDCIKEVIAVDINNYSDYEKFKISHKRIGFANCHDERYDLWICELYQDVNTEKYSILLTADSDEQWTVFEFDKVDD